MNFIVFCLVTSVLNIQVCNSQSTKYLYSDEFTKTLPTFSMREVRKHNTENDAWLVVDGYIYNITEFMSHHPGGDIIKRDIGKDVTHLFDIWHRGKYSIARNTLPLLLIGRVNRNIDNFEFVSIFALILIIVGLSYGLYRILSSEMFMDFYDSLYKRHFKSNQIEPEKLN